MTLGAFARAVGASPRWVQNAFQALGIRAAYTEAEARQLALARLLKETCGLPLRKGFPLAKDALREWPNSRIWEITDPTRATGVVVDLEQFLAGFAVTLSLARCWFAEKRRGRPRKTRRRGLALASWYGVDATLLEENLKRTPAERLERLEQAAAFFKGGRASA
jgi:hypothetical protein